MGGLKLKWEVPNLHKNQSIIPDCLKCNEKKNKR